jgi:hypothetical protein
VFFENLDLLFLSILEDMEGRLLQTGDRMPIMADNDIHDYKV